MITHLVLFDLHDASEAPEVVRRLHALLGEVPTLRTMQAGVDVVRSERSYDVGLVATFDSLDDLGAYAGHPSHQAFSSWLRDRVASVVAVDFES